VNTNGTDIIPGIGAAIPQLACIPVHSAVSWTNGAMIKRSQNKGFYSVAKLLICPTIESLVISIIQKIKLAFFEILLNLHPLSVRSSAGRARDS
jgi:hypothetical protein